MTRNVLLPWERLLWSGRPWQLRRLLRGERYLLTDFRLLHIRGAAATELALDDIGEIHRAQSTTDRVWGTSTIAVQTPDGEVAITLASVRLRRQWT